MRRPHRLVTRTSITGSAPVILFLVVAACSGGGDNGGEPNDDPTGPPPPPPPAASAYAGGWTGMTSQSRPIAIHVDDAGIALIMVGWSMTGIGTNCPASIVNFFPFENPTPPLAMASGAFTTTSTFTTGTRTVSGTLSSSGSASGMLNVVDNPCGGTLNATWTATKASTAVINLTGTWNGTLRSSLVSQTNVTFFLVQSGTTLSGTYSVPGTEAAGTAAGTVVGQTAKFTLTQTAPAACTGTFSGHAVLLAGTNPVLFYFYSGADCLGIHTMGSGTATRSS